MKEELRPAHEVVVERIWQHILALGGLEEQRQQHILALRGLGREPDPISVPPEFAEITRLEKIGGLDALLDVLQAMIIPEDKLSSVLEGLKKFTFSHAIVTEAIEALTKRLEETAKSRVEHEVNAA